MTTKYEQISSSLFIKNRKKFVEKMQPKSLAIFNSNDIYPKFRFYDAFCAA
jgi:Xaa-Pro aminopeptidase